MKICIYGAGAIGGFIGTRLATLADCQVSAVARGATLAALQAHGWRLRQGGALVMAPCQASASPAELGVQDLVVIGDTCVRLLDEGRRADVRPGATTSPGVRALHEALGRRVRPRGKVMLREALDLIRPRVKSPMESRARLMFVRAGFPEPVVNLPILDEAGDFLAEGDLVWPDQRVIGEYQGEHHADRRRRSADSGRGHLLRSHIWTHEELWAEDVFHRPRRIAALRRFAEHLDLDPKTLLIA